MGQRALPNFPTPQPSSPAHQRAALPAFEVESGDC